MENLSKFISSTKDVVEKKANELARKLVLEKLSDAFATGGLAGVSEQMLALSHVEPVWIQKDSPEFSQMREKLQTKAGLVIANHPGVLWDVPALLQALISEKGKQPRDDIKIVVSKQFIDMFTQFFDERYFIRNSDLRSTDQLREMLDHIRAGGIIILFPTGGDDEYHGFLVKDFRAGFRALINQMSPDDMVYTFNFNDSDIREIEIKHPNTKREVASDLLLPFIDSEEKVVDPYRVDEQYTEAQEWKDALEGVATKDRNIALTDKYREMFYKE